MRLLQALVVLLSVSACGLFTPQPQDPPPVLGGGAGGGGGGGGEAIFVTDGGGGGTAAFCGSGAEVGAVDEGPSPQPISGGTMVALSNGGLVVADPDRAALWLVSADLRTVDRVALAVGDDPGRVVEGSPGKVYVALRRREAVVELEVATHALRPLTTCALPRGLAWDATNQRLAVACLDGAVEWLTPSTGARSAVSVNGTLSDLRDVALDGDRLLISTLRSASLFAVASDGAVTSLSAPAVSGYEPHVGWRLMRGSDGVSRFVRQQHRTTTLPATTSCSAYGGFVKDTRNSGGGPGNAPTHNVVTSELLTVRGTTLDARPLSEGFNNVILPVDFASSPSGRVAIASAGTGFVTVLELGQRRDLLVTNRLVDSQLTSVAFSGERLFAFVREPARVVELTSDGVVLNEVPFTAAEPSRSTGHELFHRGTRANIACASCHPEAGDDGFVWPFAEGSFRTPSLRGGLGGTAPFHWTGDMPGMFDLMSNVMALRMSGPTVALEGAQSVEDWLHAQPALPLPSLDTAQVARGEQVFTSAGCDSCHVGAQGTNNASVDVGTGAAFQVPRLTDFARRAPWFHDGRMRTLAERFSPTAGGDLHGNVSSLTADQKTDLLEYLRSR